MMMMSRRPAIAVARGRVQTRATRRPQTQAAIAVGRKYRPTRGVNALLLLVRGKRRASTAATLQAFTIFTNSWRSGAVGGDVRPNAWNVMAPPVRQTAM